jgi:hypothetical protein
MGLFEDGTNRRRAVYSSFLANRFEVSTHHSNRVISDRTQIDPTQRHRFGQNLKNF